VKTNLLIAAGTLAGSFGVGMLLHRKLERDTEFYGLLGLREIDLRI